MPLLARASLNNDIFLYRRYGCTPNFTTKIQNMAKQGSLKLHYQVLERKVILTRDTRIYIFNKPVTKNRKTATTVSKAKSSQLRTVPVAPIIHLIPKWPPF